MIVKRRQQDVQRDLVRRLLPRRAFDQRDHAVEEASRRGSAVMRMRSQSLMTVVPPVTELRMSVPGSLSTGADSPVIAASFT